MIKMPSLAESFIVKVLNDESVIMILPINQQGISKSHAALAGNSRAATDRHFCGRI